MDNNSHVKGNVKQLALVALPLMFSSFSAMGMLFVDRLVLAGYSVDAHNAAVEASNFGWAFITGWSTLASVTQIFVAQNFGAGKLSHLGRPVWQMIWFGLLSSLFFIPMAIWVPTLLFENDHTQQLQRTYLYWTILFGPCHCLFYALCGFFIGQGKTILTSVAVFVGNLTNAALCYILVYGWEGYLTPMGAIGAAIATNLSIFSQVLILSSAFFFPSNRKKFGTFDWTWKPELFKDCLRVGLPSALFGILEVTGWAIFYKMMVSLGPTHLTVAGIVQNILILFNFFGDGLFRAVATLCGNAFGARRYDVIYKVVRSGFILMTIFMFCFALFIWTMHPFIINLFLHSATENEQLLLNSALIFGLANAVIYKYLEGLRLVLSGALTSTADTFFLLIGGSCSIWFFMVMPVYFLVVRQNGSIESALLICSSYTLVSALIYGWRFYSGVWSKNSSLVEAN